jgi:hypothetical protein
LNNSGGGYIYHGASGLIVEQLKGVGVGGVGRSGIEGDRQIRRRRQRYERLNSSGGDFLYHGARGWFHFL